MKNIGLNIIIRVLIFLAFLSVLWFGIEYVLKRANDNQWEHAGLNYVSEYSNTYDVLFVGTSIVITNISNEELYLKYGIAGVTVGNPEQTVYLSYYSIKDALAYQVPKVVIFDTNALFYDEEKMKTDMDSDEYHYLHFTLDDMNDLQIKYEAFCQASELDSDLDFWDYFSTIYYNHSNWEDLTAQHFQRSTSEMIMNGNLMMLSILNSDAYDLRNQGSSAGYADISELNLTYFNKLVELCSENGIPLILTRGSGWSSWERYNAVQQLAEENELPYLDLVDYAEQMDLDLRVDCADGNHFNVAGAQKWTDVIGDYLTSHYDFEDRRLDSAYDSYKDQQEWYETVLQAMKDKIALLEATDFDSYLSALADLDDENTSVFIAVRDEGTEKLTEEETAQLEDLGLTADLQGKFRYSYAAVIGEAGTQEMLMEDQITMEGSLSDGTTWQVVSAGYDAGKQASILINGAEQAANKRGINIVVYNSAVGEVISSTWFDTYQYENPPQSKVSTVEQEQYEEDVNEWAAMEEYVG